MSEHNTATQPLLQVDGLKMYFPVRSGFLRQNKSVVKAVDDVSFSINQGETFGLVGESGCGKTTVGKCILDILRPTQGVIQYAGTNLTGQSARARNAMRREIQLIFQDPYGSLNPRQSAFSMLKEALSLGEEKYTSRQMEERVDELLETVGLNAEIGARYPHELSGGQRQRLGIARALACGPRLIVCDEPVSALDVSIQAQIINLFQELQKRLGLTYLFIAHDLAVVRHIADRVGVMYLGEIVEVMDSQTLYTAPCHPYTLALLSAVPTTDYRKEKQRSRIVLQGEVPSPANKPRGCPFHPRCVYATQECRTKPPRLRDIGAGHLVACPYAEQLKSL